MSTHIKTLKGIKESKTSTDKIETTISLTRFWGGANRMQCVQITQRRDKSNPPNDTDKWFNSMQLTRHQAKMLAVELMLFAEGI